MKFYVGNKIIAQNYNDKLLDWCNKNLVIKNPEYYKKLRMGKWVGNIPESFCMYEKDGNNLILPFGSVGKIMKEFSECGFYTLIKPSESFQCDSGINLYGYQQKAVEASLEAKNGILVMPCGSGKTQTALEIVSRLGLKTLWLTHTQELLNQSLNRAKSVLTCFNSTYGTITGGKVNIGSGITFATVQTMAKLDLTQYRDTWGCVIVDECHKCIGGPTKVMQFYKVLSNLSCRYKFGLTATPKRADGLEDAMFALLGDIIYEVSKEDVAETTCPVKVKYIETQYWPDMDVALSGDGTINYAGLVDDLTHNKERFDLVLSTLHKIDGPSIVLGNRVEYLQKLDGEFLGRSVCLSSFGNSKVAKAERKDVLKKLNDGELDCVFATYQLAKEGLDVPNLRYIIFATPEKDETTVTQAAGRVSRKSDGKEFGTVIDFVDPFGMLKGWKKKRERIYKKLDYIILT